MRLSDSLAPAAAFAPAAALALALAAGAASPLPAEPLFTGVFSRGTDAYLLWALPDWQQFQAKWREAGNQGLHLVAVRTYAVAGHRYYAGAWRAGGDRGELATGLDAAAFQARNRELAGRGLRLVDLDTWLDGGQRKFLGAWRAGKDRQELALDLDGAALASRDEGLAASGLRPARIRAYRDRGRLRFLVLWSAGEGDHQLLSGLDAAGLASNQADLARQGLQLVDVDAYDDDRSRRRFAGIWRAGAEPASSWTGDWESFVARWHELAGQGERLIALAVAPGGCRDACANQVVANHPYDYGIRATASHCQGLPGSCGTPVSGATVAYHWPVTADGTGHYIRLSALAGREAPFTLPFADHGVKRRAVWLYGPGNWHHAADFARDDERTFAVRAAAPGKVLFVGWDPWSGNTVIVSHDAGGVTDAYRTIYMHLRDGARHDCEAAWSQTMAHPPANDRELAAYRVHLLATGCAEDPAGRRLDPRHWGTEGETIDRRLLGKRVATGTFLAWAGDTGPGGKRGPGGPNTHLHVFFARRDPSDQKWYFFDPYGIYGQPDCYPLRLTDPVTGPCVRYPVAWTGGRPRFP
jgi:murein DD-endopeptidase MepM/ murein hydrolase activator NlpD